MTVKTRFAPSPTGYLHIGGARTALFNYLFAKKHGGEFLLRIEDTDIARSTESAKKAIIESLSWLDLKHDGKIIYQSQNAKRHSQIAQELVDSGKAYYCFTPQEEITKMRDESISSGKHFIFHSPWRDKSTDQHPKGGRHVVRLKAPREGETIIKDLLQGDVIIQNDHLDDMILLRSDGTPTYMLAVVVDDHDMGITHIIRGDDHLNNASRQQLIYQALGWDVPKMVHIPLIHGPDGAKLSKRHGALGADSYKDMGYLPEAINNYLLRLGWSHGDDEVIPRSDAIKWFGVEGLGKSPSRLDFDKMKHMNAVYLRDMKNDDLAKIIFKNIDFEISDQSKENIIKSIDSLKPRAELTTDLLDLAMIYVVDKPIEYNSDALDLISSCNKNLIKQVINSLEDLPNLGFDKDVIQSSLKGVAKANEMKLGEIMKYVRAFLTGRSSSPSVFELIEILGKDVTMSRLKK